MSRSAAQQVLGPSMKTIGKEVNKGVKKAVATGKKAVRKVEKALGMMQKPKNSAIRSQHLDIIRMANKLRQHSKPARPGNNRVAAPVIIKKREFIQTVNGTSNFQVVVTQPISCLNTLLFPWGSSILPQYEEYRLKRATFQYISTSGSISSTAALGSVVMGIVYDPNDNQILDRSTLLNYNGFKSACADKNFSVSVDTSHNPLPIRYVSHNTTAVEFNDYAIFYLATDTNPGTSQLGQLWVDYEIEMYVPRPAFANTQQIFQANLVGDGTGDSLGKQLSRQAPNPQAGPAYCYFSGTTNGVLYFASPGFYKINVNCTAAVGTNGWAYTPIPAALSGGATYIQPTWEISGGELNQLAPYVSMNGAFATNDLLINNFYLDCSTSFVNNGTAFHIAETLIGTAHCTISITITKIPCPIAKPINALTMSSQLNDLHLQVAELKKIINNTKEEVDENKETILSTVSNNSNNNNSSSSLYRGDVSYVGKYADSPSPNYVNLDTSQFKLDESRFKENRENVPPNSRSSSKK